MSLPPPSRSSLTPSELFFATSLTMLSHAIVNFQNRQATTNLTSSSQGNPFRTLLKGRPVRICGYVTGLCWHPLKPPLCQQQGTTLGQQSGVVRGGEMPFRGGRIARVHMAGRGGMVGGMGAMRNNMMASGGGFHKGFVGHGA